MSSDSQRDLTSRMLKVNSSALGERRLGRARGHWEAELLSLRRHNSAQWGTKALASAISLSHPPAETLKGTSSPNLLASLKHPMLCFCGSIPLTRLASLPVLQGPSLRGSPMAKQAEPAPPTPVHLADPPQLICQIPSKQHHKPGSVQVAQTGATPLHSESCPWERGK